jgi:hypothetical protein
MKVTACMAFGSQRTWVPLLYYFNDVASFEIEDVFALRCQNKWNKMISYKQANQAPQKEKRSTPNPNKSYSRSESKSNSPFAHKSSAIVPPAEHKFTWPLAIRLQYP